MSDLESVFTSLFTAPTKAVTDAEVEYRKTWIRWLRDLQALIATRKDKVGDPLTPEQEKALIEKQLNLSPVMRLGGTVEVAITMRLASVTKKEGSVSLGVGVGAFQAAGSFGFSSQSSQESVLQARAMYGITNAREMNLGTFLTEFKLTLEKGTDLDKAITLLSSSAPPEAPKVD